MVHEENAKISRLEKLIKQYSNNNSNTSDCHSLSRNQTKKTSNHKNDSNDLYQMNSHSFSRSHNIKTTNDSIRRGDSMTNGGNSSVVSELKSKHSKHSITSSSNNSHSLSRNHSIRTTNEDRSSITNRTIMTQSTVRPGRMITMMMPLLSADE